MGALADIEKRCDGHIMQTTSKGAFGPSSGRCGDNLTTVEYWKARNNSAITNWSDIMTNSGGSKLPPCNNHNIASNDPSYEDMAVGQENCTGYRSGSGTLATADNSETTIKGGQNSFVYNLYSQINNELNARKQHSSYENKQNITAPNAGIQMHTNNLNDAIDIINSYANVIQSDNVQSIGGKVNSNSSVKKSDFSTLKTNFNTNVVSNCICYSDCAGYSVCYCYGNCNYY